MRRQPEIVAFMVGLQMQFGLHPVHDIDHAAELRHEEGVHHGLAEVSLKCTSTPAGTTGWLTIDTLLGLEE